MTNFTISVSAELKNEMNKHREINWPEYFKKKFGIKINELKKFQELKNSRKI